MAADALSRWRLSMVELLPESQTCSMVRSVGLSGVAQKGVKLFESICILMSKSTHLVYDSVTHLIEQRIP